MYIYIYIYICIMCVSMYMLLHFSLGCVVEALKNLQTVDRRVCPSSGALGRAGTVS